MVAKHLKSPLYTALNGFGTYCCKKIMDKAVVMCPDSALIKHMIMHSDEHEGHPLREVVTLLPQSKR